MSAHHSGTQQDDSGAGDDGRTGLGDRRASSDLDGFWVEGAIPAATVIVLRDGPTGLETLMLRRDGKLAFAAGMWVFPGGRIDKADHSTTGSLPRGSDMRELASRAAARRETVEETGLELDPDSLIRWSHWTAPIQSPRRFTTAFYVADLGSSASDVRIDDGEIQEFMWKSPAEVISQRDEGSLGLTPPTFITLIQMMRFNTVAEATSSARTMAAGGGIEHFQTHFDFIGETMIAMYHGDAGYESGDVHASGRRHRLSMGSVWRYERDE